MTQSRSGNPALANHRGENRKLPDDLAQQNLNQLVAIPIGWIGSRDPTNITNKPGPIPAPTVLKSPGSTLNCNRGNPQLTIG